MSRSRHPANVTGSRAALYIWITKAGTIPSELNNTESDMDKLRSHTSEAAWRGPSCCEARRHRTKPAGDLPAAWH